HAHGRRPAAGGGPGPGCRRPAPRPGGGGVSLPTPYPIAPRPKGKLAIHRLRGQVPLTDAEVEEFLAEHEVPIVEGPRSTFLYRGQADAVAVLHRIVNQPQHVPMKRLDVL